MKAIVSREKNCIYYKLNNQLMHVILGSEERAYRNMCAEQQLYQLVEDEPAAMTNATINTFYTSQQNTSIGKFNQVEAAIAAQDNTLAASLNNSILPITNTEVSEKEYYQLYLKWISDVSNFSVQDKNDLLVLANRCLTKRGPVVIKARTLYDLITNAKNAYSNTCASSTNSKIINAFAYDGADDSQAEGNKNHQNKAIEVAISPNPSNGQFSLYFEKSVENPIFISITNLNGQLIWQQEAEENVQQIDLDLKSINNGIYIITVSDNHTIDFRTKLVISKND
jgi:Secretion system C-terminal sorting domain